MKIGKKCIGCGQCAAYCPFDAITVFGCAAVNENCRECGKCIDYCPVYAISEV